MNASSEFTKLTITLPRDLLEDLKASVTNLSRYISEATRERRKREKREQAWKELLAAPATFTEIADPVQYIEELRAGDDERLKAMGIW
jgi:post-segregation antitoxin (ccd killing protein)